MTDWIKLVLPLVAVAMTTVFTAFLTDLVGELRTGRTIVYSLDQGTDAVTLRLANVSNVTIAEEEFVLRCEDAPASGGATSPPCFAAQPDGTWYVHESQGAVPVRRIERAPGNGATQVGFELTLLPGARSTLAIATGAGRAADVYVRWDPAPNPQPLRLIQAGGVPGYIVLNYLQVLAWAFVVALAAVGLVVALGLLGIVILFFFRWLGSLAWLRGLVGLTDPPPAFSKFTMEVDNDALQASFTLAPADPASRPRASG